MPIRWSALQVSQAMDEVALLLAYAESDLRQAEEKTREAAGIAGLPDYLHQRLARLCYTIQARSRMVDAVESVRQSIPDGAVEAERKAREQGTTACLL